MQPYLLPPCSLPRLSYRTVISRPPGSPRQTTTSQNAGLAISLPGWSLAEAGSLHARFVGARWEPQESPQSPAWAFGQRPSANALTLSKPCRMQTSEETCLPGQKLSGMSGQGGQQVGKVMGLARERRLELKAIARVAGFVASFPEGKSRRGYHADRSISECIISMAPIECAAGSCTASSRRILLLSNPVCGQPHSATR